MVFDRGLDQLVPERLHLRPQRIRDPDLGDRRAEFVVPDVRLHGHDVDHAGEEVRLAQGILHRERIRAEPLPHHADDVVEVGTGTVHLVDEGDPRHAVPVGLAPHGLGLGLDSAYGTKNSDRPVQHSERPLDLGREVHVTGRVDDIDPVFRIVALPECGGRRGRDRDSALLLLLHPVHGRGALMHFAHPVQTTGIEQNTLRRRRLAGVDVRHDADVPEPRQWCHSGHDLFRNSGSFHLSNSIPARIPPIRRQAGGPATAGRKTTSGSARRLCWLRPSDGCRPFSSQWHLRPGLRRAVRPPAAGPCSVPRATARSRSAT